MFKLFPGTLTADGVKKPLIDEWKLKATNDPTQIQAWQTHFGQRLNYWAIPCGETNGLLVLDVDVKSNGFETLKNSNLELPDTLCQRTLRGGAHYFFRYPRDGATYGNRVGFLPGLDIRGEGGYVFFYGHEFDPNKVIAEAPAWLLEHAKKVEHVIEGNPAKVSDTIAKETLERALEAIREAPAGEANNTLNIEAFKVGQVVAGGGFLREFAFAELMKAARERGKSESEAKATINSGLDGGAKKPITSPFDAPQAQIEIPIVPPPPQVVRWTPEPLTRFDLLNTAKLKKPQLFRDWSTEDIHIVTADGGTGKTTLMLVESVCLALGERFLGFDCVQPGRTLYITGEDTDKKLAAMLGEIVRQMGLLEDTPTNREKVETILKSIRIKKESDMCLITKDKSGFMFPNQDAMRKVLEAVEDFQPKMIVFDPIASFWGSESALNDMAKAVAKFLSHLTEASNACVQIINHMGKVSSSTKDMSQFAGRGGTGLPSHARVSRALRPVFEEEYLDLTREHLDDRKSAMMCHVNKFSDGSPLYNKPFLIEREGYLFTRRALSDAKLREQETKQSDTERIFAFIKEARMDDKFVTRTVVQGKFKNTADPISKDRVKEALELLQFEGHMGEFIKPIENPDQTCRDKVYIITDKDGREV